MSKQNTFNDKFTRITDGEGLHQGDLERVTDEDIDDAIERLHQEANEYDELPRLRIGGGGLLYLGYDAEWHFTGIDREKPLNVLSYQFYAVGPGGEMSVVYFPRSGERYALLDMVRDVVNECLRTGLLLDYPSHVVMAGFMTRSDLAVTSDMLEWRNLLSNIGGKLATSRDGIPLVCSRRDYERLDRNKSLACGGGIGACQVTLLVCDVAKHAPEKTALADLGELVGLQKMTLPLGYSKEKMDVLLAERRDFFIEYGIRDAEIAVKYYLQVLKLAQQHIGGKKIESGILPVSAGALAVQKCLKMIEHEGLDYYEVFGFTNAYREVWDDEEFSLRGSNFRIKDGHRRFHEGFASDCYHGGINIARYVGPTPVEYDPINQSVTSRIHDYDLKGAYTTGMLSIRQIDYSRSRETKVVDDFLGDVMGFAWVNFKFPPGTRQPCLPVRTDTHGLRYPLRGRSYCTAPEIALAKRLNADISINRGVIYPWSSDDTRIFLPFVRWVKELRASFDKGSLSEQMVKLWGNSLYGKTGQGLHEKTVFDTGMEMSVKVPESDVSNGPMAAHVTGFIRALMAEIMNGVPPHRRIVSCTTDGILTDASLEEMDLSGELCGRFQGLVDMLEVENG